MRRATLRLLLDCNNNCIFCSQDGWPAQPGETSPLTERLAALRALSDELSLVGGEPTLAPDLSDIVRAARAAGFRRVGLQTNGRRLAHAPLARALAEAGLTDVHVSLHGATPAIHDYHTGAPGSFAELLAAVAACRTAGLTIAATTVLTRSSFRSLGELPRLLRLRDVSAWLIAVPRAAGRATPSFDRILPRLGLALPFALHALDSARRRGLPAWIQGAPLCALGPFAPRALSDEPRAYAPLCGECPARPACPGLDPLYLARFDGDELAPRAAPPSATPGDGEAALARMFVGLGELPLPPASVADNAPARAARAFLPILGKVRPAAREVSAQTPRKTGEALREIFPDLFEKK